MIFSITSMSLREAGGRPECCPQIILSISWNLKIKSSSSTSTRLAPATHSPSTLSSLNFSTMRRPSLLLSLRYGPDSLKISYKSDGNLVQFNSALIRPIKSLFLEIRKQSLVQSCYWKLYLSISLKSTNWKKPPLWNLKSRLLLLPTLLSLLKLERCLSKN